MDVVLHIGAHRTGTTAVQRKLQNGIDHLKSEGIVFWGPKRTRQSGFRMIISGNGNQAEDASGDDELTLNRSILNARMRLLALRGKRRLIISEENLLGTMRENLKAAQLYPWVATRLTPMASFLDGNCDRIFLTIRPYEAYWASTIAYMINRVGFSPNPMKINEIAQGDRGWRAVIEDVRAVFPNAVLSVWEYGADADHMAHFCRSLSASDLLAATPLARANASPGIEKMREGLLAQGDAEAAQVLNVESGRYQPFCAEQMAVMQERYRQDTDWLLAQPSEQIEFIQNTGANIRSAG